MLDRRAGQLAHDQDIFTRDVFAEVVRRLTAEMTSSGIRHVDLRVGVLMHRWPWIGSLADAIGAFKAAMPGSDALTILLPKAGAADQRGRASRRVCCRRRVAAVRVRGHRVSGAGRSANRGGTGHGRARTSPRTGAEKATDGAGGSGFADRSHPNHYLTWHFRRPARCRHYPRYPGLAWCLGCRARRRCAGWRRWHGAPATRACPSRRVFSAGSTSMTRRREAAIRDSSASSSSSWSSIDLTCSPFKGLTTKHERGARRGSGRGGLCLRCRRRVSRCARETRIGECARRR